MLHETLTVLLLVMLCNAYKIKDKMVIEVAALGRPLYPGMLYDCRSDQHFPGFLLWRNNPRHVRQQRKTDLKLSASDTFSEKANLLNMSTSLRASFLAGLVDVDGAAKYLQDTKSSARQLRVAVHYSQTTKFEEFYLDELGNITYPKWFPQNMATHVITSVLYGAQAFMIFQSTASEDEDKQKVEENLLAMVKKMPTFSIEGRGSINMNENDTKMAEKISMSLYSNYNLKEIPLTFIDYVKLYKELPSLLTDEEALPVRVWAYPLSVFNDQAAKLEREISVSLEFKVEHLFEEMDDIERRCNDLTRFKGINDFLDVKQRLQTFKKLLSNHKSAFQDALLKVLPDIRGGKQEEQVLVNLVNNHYNSPFTTDNLNKWLNNSLTELNILSSYTRGLKSIKVVTSKYSVVFLHPEVDVFVCLSFTSLKYEDKYLETLKDFLESEDLVQTNYTAYAFQELKSWLTNDVLKRMDRILSLFTSFSRANKNEKAIQFIIASFPDPSNPGASIQLYKQNKLTNPNFEPVSRPPPPILKTQDGALTLLLQKSSTGDTVQFRVEYREVKSDGQEETWETRDTSDTQIQFLLNGLQPQKMYCVRYKAVGPVGFSEPSKCVYYPPTHNNIINPTLVGGNGGSEWTFKTCDFSEAIKEMNVSVSDKVQAISLTLRGGHEEHFGQHTTESVKTFTFHDGDKFLSLMLWPNQVGDRLGGIEFEVVRENGQRLIFSAQSSSLGSPVHIDVGSGVCCGLAGRSESDIDSLGFFFQN